MKKFGVLLVPLLLIGFTGCGLIDDVFNPGSGYLKVKIKGPAGVSINVTVSKDQKVVDRLNDDGRGFQKLIAVKPGAYVVTASPAEGFTAFVSVTEASGNSTEPDQHNVAVSLDATSEAIVTYVIKATVNP
jgi:hypothetical protein